MSRKNFSISKRAGHVFFHFRWFNPNTRWSDLDCSARFHPLCRTTCNPIPSLVTVNSAIHEKLRLAIDIVAGCVVFFLVSYVYKTLLLLEIQSSLLLDESSSKKPTVAQAPPIPAMPTPRIPAYQDTPRVTLIDVHSQLDTIRTASTAIPSQQHNSTTPSIAVSSSQYTSITLPSYRLQSKE